MQPDQLVRYADAKKMLSALLRRQNRERPISRLLSETGRLSHTPLFVVGVFSGHEQLGEGHASSLKLAERLAAKDAILKHFGEEAEIRLPSDMEVSELAWVSPRLADSVPIV